MKLNKGITILISILLVLGLAGCEEENSNADLASITMSSGILSPTFSPDTESYGASSCNLESETITVETDDSSATVAIRINSGTWTELDSGSPYSIGGLDSSKTIEILVTAEDGSTRMYSVDATSDVL